MSYCEQAIIFPCVSEELLGIVAVPNQPKTTGVLIVVGGPQTRVGSHRQFLLLSRYLAAAGFPVMRFDFRGMGDSTGELRNFEAINEDIGAAIDAFQANCPQIERIVLWGLCDAASAVLLYWDGLRDNRLSGLVLLNPWVRSSLTLAKTQIKHYYGQRLMQAEFWRKLLSGKLGVARAIGGFFGTLNSARQRNDLQRSEEILSFQKRMLRGIQDFRGQVLILLSEDDYTAKEFLEAVRDDQAWCEVLKQANVTQVSIAEADHTFSSAELRDQVEKLTKQWLETKACK